MGNTVYMGSRTANNEKALAFVANHKGKAFAGTFAEAAFSGEIVFNCTKGGASLEALKQAGEKNMEGKILVDIANPLDFSRGAPPSLSIVNTNSLAEEIQKSFPKAKVVKALNTMWCGLMVNPLMIGGGNHSTFICGNDSASKEKVKEILISFGWSDRNIIDLGTSPSKRNRNVPSFMAKYIWYFKQWRFQYQGSQLMQ